MLTRHAEQNGWIWVHLEGSPAEIGYQHGYLLAPEIRDTLQTVSLEMSHDEKKDWQFFREQGAEHALAARGGGVSRRIAGHRRRRRRRTA